MKKIRLISSVVFILSASIVKSQYPGLAPGYYGHGVRGSIAINSGNIAGLKGVKHVNIIYDYSNMGVGAYRTENDFLKKKEEEYGKEHAKYEDFRYNWFHARKELFEPKFEYLFNKTGSLAGISGTNNGTDAEITLKVATIHIDPGYTIGVPATIDLECTFLDKNGNEIVRYFIRNAPGSTVVGIGFEAGTRIAEGYAKAAKMLMKDIKKKLRKLD